VKFKQIESDQGIGGESENNGVEYLNQDKIEDTKDNSGIFNMFWY